MTSDQPKQRLMTCFAQVCPGLRKLGLCFIQVEQLTFEYCTGAALQMTHEWQSHAGKEGTQFTSPPYPREFYRMLKNTFHTIPFYFMLHGTCGTHSPLETAHDGCVQLEGTSGAGTFVVAGCHSRCMRLELTTTHLRMMACTLDDGAAERRVPSLPGGLSAMDHITKDQAEDSMKLKASTR